MRASPRHRRRASASCADNASGLVVIVLVLGLPTIGAWNQDGMRSGLETFFGILLFWGVVLMYGRHHARKGTATRTNDDGDRPWDGLDVTGAARPQK